MSIRLSLVLALLSVRSIKELTMKIDKKRLLYRWCYYQAHIDSDSDSIKRHKGKDTVNSSRVQT